MDWGIVYYRAESGEIPAEVFLERCPSKIEARFNSVLETVRAAPPPRFSGGGYWEAMHGEMGGYYEIRLTGPGRRQYRLFCLLDNADEAGLRKRGFTEPKIAVITGLVKPSGERFSDREYVRVRAMGGEYLGDGEHTPTLPTLVRISQRLGIELLIDIKPAGTESRLAKASARNTGQTLPVTIGLSEVGCRVRLGPRHRPACAPRRRF